MYGPSIPVETAVCVMSKGVEGTVVHMMSVGKDGHDTVGHGRYCSR